MCGVPTYCHIVTYIQVISFHIMDGMPTYVRLNLIHFRVFQWFAQKSESEVVQSCPTLCNYMDCSLPGSSIYGIFQARVLEQVAVSFSRRSSQPRDWTHIVSRCFTIWATGEVLVADLLRVGVNMHFVEYLAKLNPSSLWTLSSHLTIF